MLIEITKEQQDILLQVIDKGTFKGEVAHLVVDLKKAVGTEVKKKEK